MASIPTRRRSLPAATLLVTVVYVLGAAVALLLGGLAVLAVTAARLTALLGTGRGAAPWS